LNTQVTVKTSCDLKIDSFTGSGTTLNTLITDGGLGQMVHLIGAISDSSASSIDWQATLPNGVTQSGFGNSADIWWEGTDGAGKIVDPGVYTVTLNAWEPNNNTCSDSKTATITVEKIKDCTLQVTISSSANVASGNLSHSQLLFSTKGTGLTTNIALYYNSRDSYIGPLGTGWVNSYDIALKENSNGSVVLRTGSGGKKLYMKSDSGYTSQPGDYSILTKNNDGTFVITQTDGTKYTFGTDGKITSIVDRNGNTLTMGYTNGNLTTITDPAGRITVLNYDASNHITSVTDPIGNVYSFTVSGNFLTSVTYPNGGQWSYTYDSNAFMLTKTDPDNNTVTYTYDQNHRLLTSTDPEGKTRTMTYPTGTDTTKTTTFTETDGGLWQYTYNTQAGTLTSKTDPNGNSTSYNYDQNQNMLSKTDPDGTTTSYAYDSQGNMTSKTDALAQTTSYTYDSFGQVTSIKDPQGNTTLSAYDTKGNLTSSTDPAGATTTYQYDSKGNVTAVTNAAGQTTTYSYDQNSNLSTITDSTGATTRFTYDANGNVTSQTDANGSITTFAYDSQNHLVKTTDSNGNVTTYGYDKNGNRTTMTDANGNTTLYEYNSKSQVIQVTDALGNITSYAYGSTGGSSCSSCGGGEDKLTTIVDAKGNTTKYEYDTSGRLVKEIDPLGNTITYTYDSKGNLTSKTDANGATITYTYDAINRLSKKTYPDGTTASFTYDAKGNILTATNANISYTFTYDANNRVTSVMDSKSRTIGYEYNSLGSKTKLITPEGKTITYTYDDANRLQKITNGGTFTFAYDKQGRRTKLAYPNGATANYVYDTAGRLTSLNHKTSKGEIIDSFNYTLDNVGNRLAKTGMDENIAYTYDAIYRLQRAIGSHHHGAEKYTYDPAGNRLIGPDEELAYTYNAGNQLTDRSRKERHDEDKNTEYGYDKSGNLVKKIRHNDDKGRDDKTTLYTYDYENRLIKVVTQKHNKQTIVSFTYDPFGRRLSKTVERDEIEKDEHEKHDKDSDKDDHDHHAPRTTTYIYDNQNFLMEYDQNGKIKARYIQGLSTDEHLAIEKKDDVYYYHADGLGSITALTDKKQKVVESYAYSSFGELKRDGNKIEQPYTFTGREWDEETGLYYYRARYYDPQNGRFISFDPALNPTNGPARQGCSKTALTLFSQALQSPLKLNPFIYVMNNAVNLTDPSGLAPWEGAPCTTCDWSAILSYLAHETRTDPDTLIDVTACAVSFIEAAKNRNPEFINWAICRKATTEVLLHAPDAFSINCKKGVYDDCERCIITGAQ
jgi:RHS repeat-associated protein